MSRKIRLIVAVCVLLLVVSVGINIAQAVTDGTPEPGSSQDPLISKSYVDQVADQLNQTIQALKSQVDQLKTNNDSLTQKLAAQDTAIKALQDAVNNAKTQTSGTTKPSTPSTSSTPSSSADTTQKGIVTVAALNVRSQANTTSAIVAKALKGESVTIVSKNGDWYKIKTAKGVTGYALGKYLSVK